MAVDQLGVVKPLVVATAWEVTSPRVGAPAPDLPAAVVALTQLSSGRTGSHPEARQHAAGLRGPD